jgi:hypothetical protein
MAHYVSVGTRRRRAVIAVIAAALIAFGIGWLIGRQQVPSVDERVSDVRAQAVDISTSIERLDIEYEQVLTGGDTVEGGVLEPLDDLRTDLIGTLDDAPWIATSTRSALLDSLAEIESRVTAGASLDDVRAALAQSADQVREAFAIT